MTDYSRSRHSHPDSVSCAESGDGGHPPWWSPLDVERVVDGLHNSDHMPREYRIELALARLPEPANADCPICRAGRGYCMNHYPSIAAASAPEPLDERKAGPTPASLRRRLKGDRYDRAIY